MNFTPKQVEDMKVLSSELIGVFRTHDLSYFEEKVVLDTLVKAWVMQAKKVFEDGL